MSENESILNGHNLRDGMVMSFHGGYNEIILFDFWQTDSVSIFLVSAVILFFVAALYEGLKMLREKLIRHDSQRSRSIPARLLSKTHIIQTFMHMAQIVISYLLMLVFMTYNSWLCLSIVLGAGAGYFLFGLRRLAVDINQHCH